MGCISDDYLMTLLEDGKHPLLQTHLSLDRKGFMDIDVLQLFNKLQVIDLRNNIIFSVANLSNQSSLTHLYLQNNEIRRLEGFQGLTSLKVLFLDYNKVEVVENLHNCPLQILSIIGQRLPDGQSPAFEPFCMKTLGPHLETLVVSKNRLASIGSLRHLKSLKLLDVSFNEISDLETFLEEISLFGNLKKLLVSGNPIGNDPDHVKEIVTVCEKLEDLSGKKISLEMRSFCENMVTNRRKPKAEESFWKKSFDDSVSCLPTPFRPTMDNDFIEEVREKID